MTGGTGSTGSGDFKRRSNGRSDRGTPRGGAGTGRGAGYRRGAQDRSRDGGGFRSPSRRDGDGEAQGRRGGAGGGRAAASGSDTRPDAGSASAAEDRPKRDPGPELDPAADARQLDQQIRQELITLPRTLADHIGRHLVMVGMLMEEDPERAHKHAVYARTKASRVAAVREAAGLAAYQLGHWKEALAELRAARRMSGHDHLLALIADCERGLGRPERALELIHGAADGERPVEERVELRIVASGARRDLGEYEAALVELNGPELQERRARPWAARLFYAYAEALLALGRDAEARDYFAKAAAVDTDGATDADERLAELEGLQLVDVEGDVVWTDAEAPDAQEGAPGRG